MSNAKTPIALFAYNRPKHLQLALESLSKCERLSECDLTIFCDGAKTPEHAAKVGETRAVANEWAGRLGGKVVERQQNFGLANSSVAGLTELCERYGRVIMMEDDNVVSPIFLSFLLQGLDRYATEPQVYQISGYMFPIPKPSKSDAVFLPLTATWGWATWQRAWSAFDWNPMGARQELKDPQVRARFDLENAFAYSAMLDKRLDGELDSWSILWWWAVFKCAGLVLYPRYSLVRNIGFDGSGIHHRNSPNSPFARKINSIPDRMSFNWPERVEADLEVFDQVKSFFRTQGQSRVSRILSRFRRAMI